MEGEGISKSGPWSVVGGQWTVIASRCFPGVAIASMRRLLRRFAPRNDFLPH